jgi:hypothetical protein
MNQSNEKERRDEVLYAFHLACERPSAEEIIAWTEKYPEFAEDIRLHAAVSRDWAANKDVPVAEADETMLARAYSNALNAIYQAELEAPDPAPQRAATNFQEMLNGCGKEIWQIANELDIARSVLADLFNGWMLAPVRRRIVVALMPVLKTTRAAFDDALILALQNPRMDHAKADGAPVITPQPCDDIIRASNMSKERIRYWLEEV